MALFTYEGVERGGGRVQGTVEAPSEGEFRMSLRSKGIRPTRIVVQDSDPSKAGGFAGLVSGGGGPRISTEQLVVFTRQLQVLIGSGVPLVQALDILTEQSSTVSMKSVLVNIKDKVNAGSYFWQALAGYPNVFPKLYVALVRAGESSGALDAVFKRLTRYLEDADRLMKLLKSAMMYPIIVVVIAVGVIAGMMVFVIPKFEEMLKSSDQALPGPTQFVVDASHFIINNIVTLILGTVAFVFLTIQFVRSPEGKATMDRLLFGVPVFGPIAQKGGIARFSRTMQTLLSSGVNLIDAIDICRATVDNAVIEAAIGKIRSEVESGKTLGAVIGKISVFPKMAVQMISVGESTGNLDKMLEKVADFYEEEVQVLVAGLTKLIEPIILVVLGGAVGGMLIAMYLPVFQMAGGVK